jgi:DNA-binding SARP family transcriptional activator
MDFLILGPLEVTAGGRALELGAAKQRALLAVLLLHPNQAVSASRLIDELWGEAPIASAAKVVQGYVSGLRKALGADAIATTPGGYMARVDPRRLDAARFEALAAEGRARLQDDPAAAGERLREALALWRGRPLEGVALESVAAGEAERLEELRLSVLEQRVEADLALGRDEGLVAELRALVEAHPYRERLRAHLMLALYRAGRQAEALAAYRDARALLAEELGLDPSAELQRLERQMLVQAPELDPPERPASAPPPAPPPREPGTSARRLVSVLAARIADAPAMAERLDPESLHALLDRCAAIWTAALERHGGAVERHLGDGVVAVFGLAGTREDDPLRAARAAVEMRDAAAEAGVRLGLGLESGRVFVAGDAARGPAAAGDAIVLAERLARAAAGGEILLGEAAAGLLGASVRAGPAEPVAAEGRAAPVRARRLEGQVGDEAGPARAHAPPFVGRGRELAALRGALDAAVEGAACHMAVVVGAAGLGKSRLAHELAAAVGDRATVVAGRCLPYGDGLAYRPLAEIVGRLGGGDAQGLARLVGDGRDAEPVARLVSAAIGGSDEPATVEETSWAVRRLLEDVARERPLVAVVEDVHWAEPTLLDLIDYLVAFSSGAPILLVCLGRPELLDARPAWRAQPRTSVLALEALSEPAARTLVAARAAGLDRRASDRIVARADGNPLFLEQLVAAGVEGGEGPLPPSIHAVLAARIDRLDPGERIVLGRAAVEGVVFHAGALRELVPDEERAGLQGRVLALVRAQLVLPHRAEFAGEDAFRFAHALIRDAAYEATPKGLRADLHERLAGWLEDAPGALDEIVGHHLERSFRLRVELGPPGERERALGARGAARLEAAARAALARGMLPAAARLLERAVGLLPEDDPRRAALLPGLGAALVEAGRLADADRVLGEALGLARDLEDPGLEARARVERWFARLQAESSQGIAAARRDAQDALAELEGRGDELGQCRAWRLLSWLDWTEGRAGAADEAWRRAGELARRAGDERERFEALTWRASAAVFGPTPVAEAVAQCEETRREVAASPVAVAATLHPLAALRAMEGDVDEARRLIREGNAILDELGGLPSAACHHEAIVEMLAGRPDAAERRLRRGFERLEAIGERALLATTAAFLARALRAQGRDEEADRYCDLCERTAAAEDLSTQVIWRGARARILAARGLAAPAEALAREAVALSDPTDLLTIRADAARDLADVLAAQGRAEEAEEAAAQALALLELKGCATAVAAAADPRPHGGG